MGDCTASDRGLVGIVQGHLCVFPEDGLPDDGKVEIGRFPEKSFAGDGPLLGVERFLFAVLRDADRVDKSQHAKLLIQRVRDHAPASGFLKDTVPHEILLRTKRTLTEEGIAERYGQMLRDALHFGDSIELLHIMLVAANIVVANLVAAFDQIMKVLAKGALPLLQFRREGLDAAFHLSQGGIGASAFLDVSGLILACAFKTASLCKMIYRACPKMA